MKLIEGPQGPRVIVDGRETILLCSNDYLGLANDPCVKAAAVEAIKKYGFGSGASRLVSGNMEPHEALEEKIKNFKGTEAALVFNSGYHANLGCISALAGRSTEVFSDRLNHASIVDACILSRAAIKRYPNRNMDFLESLLKKSKAKSKLIVTDGVFSMDGSIAPLDDMACLLDKYGAMLFLDDAHATGVLGKGGKGTLEHFGIVHPSIIQMGTLGKAIGAFGAFVASSKELIDLLVSKARPFVYTTALPPSVCAAASKAIDIIGQNPDLIELLRDNTRYFKNGLAGQGLNTLGSATHIIPIVTGDAKKTMEMSATLLEKGVFIQGIRPPTVPENTSRLRVSITAVHSKEDLDSAIFAIKETVGEN